jgi:hypothetical protein
MKQRESSTTMIAAWIRLWEQLIAIENLPNLQAIPPKFEYLKPVFPGIELYESKANNFPITSKKGNLQCPKE